jgi:hypothetical protein
MGSLPVNTDSPQARLPLSAFLGAVVFKFWLIWESEISDSIEDPHEYILQVLYPINGGLAYGPGTGMVGRLFFDLHIPFRLGIEALFLVACVLMLRVIFAWPWKSWLSLGLFVFLAFDPVTVELFSHFYSDPVWLVETILGFSCIVLALQNEARPNWILLNVGALFLGLSALTRSLLIPLIAALVIFALFAFLLFFLKNRPGKRGRMISALVLSMASIFLLLGMIYEGTCAYNLRAHGYNGISAIDSAEFKKFFFCLQSVGEPDGKQNFPVDEHRRELIARAGPTSKWFMEEMDASGFYKKISMEHYGTPDIAAAWLHFAIFSEAYRGSGGDLRNCFALFSTIENEIADANRRGTLKVRPIIPLPDSRLGIIVPVYPAALRTTLQGISYEPTSADLTLNTELRYTDRDFTVALNRRAVHDSPARDLIWILLCGIYRTIYTPLLVYASLAFGFFPLTVFVVKWRRIESFSLHCLAQQIFGLFFIILPFWYALFTVSGWPALPRYMIFNHILLPVLLVYYFLTTLRLLRVDRLERREDV